jgi:CubicO group peptidase (beta-lactamase class C family)
VLEEAYSAEVRRRVLEPIGMSDAAILDDPRPLGNDYAVGYSHDIFRDPSPLPFVSLGGLAPAGSGLASATDMARYLITQMNDGVAPDGTRVASAANITETHRPGVLIGPGQLFPPEAQPDTASLRYAQGWFSETFRDGRQLLWHGGGIEGFHSLTGFLPDEKIGLVILNNSDRGGLFYLSVRASFLSRFFGLNRDLPGFLAAVVPVLDAAMAELAAQTRPVDPAAAAPYQGLYEDGFRVRLDEAGGLYLDHDIRSMPLRALSNGRYVVTAGPEVVLGQPVSFELDANGVPVMIITGFAPVRWLTGG